MVLLASVFSKTRCILLLGVKKSKAVLLEGGKSKELIYARESREYLMTDLDDFSDALYSLLENIPSKTRLDVLLEPDLVRTAFITTPKGIKSKDKDTIIKAELDKLLMGNPEPFLHDTSILTKYSRSQDIQVLDVVKETLIDDLFECLEDLDLEVTTISSTVFSHLAYIEEVIERLKTKNNTPIIYAHMWDRYTEIIATSTKRTRLVMNRIQMGNTDLTDDAVNKEIFISEFDRVTKSLVTSGRQESPIIVTPQTELGVLLNLEGMQTMADLLKDLEIKTVLKDLGTEYSLLVLS